MKSVFSNKIMYASKEFLKAYTKKDKTGKIHTVVSLDKDYPEHYAYPYDLAWRLPFRDYLSVPDLMYIEDEPVNSVITLRDDQEPYVDQLLMCPRGIFVSKPGTGKTVMCLELISRMNVKTLILVNSAYLLHQWHEECTKLLGYEPGMIGDGKFKVKDITISTFQTLAKTEKKLTKIYDKFTLVIVDEAHHCPAATFKYVLGEIQALFKLGVTGTRERKDGLEFITEWMLSDRRLVNTTDKTMKPEIIIVKTGIQIPAGDTFVECLSGLGELEKVVEVVDKMVYRNIERYQLVLVSRLSTIELLALELPEAIVITGEEGNRKGLNDRVLEDKIIVSTILNEGVNIPRLDTLHLVHPSNNMPQLEQRIARINRPLEDKRTPIVYDYWYKSNKRARGFNINGQQHNRLNYYKKRGYTVHELSL